MNRSLRRALILCCPQCRERMLHRKWLKKIQEEVKRHLREYQLANMDDPYIACQDFT